MLIAVWQILAFDINAQSHDKNKKLRPKDGIFRIEMCDAQIKGIAESSGGF